MYLNYIKSIIRNLYRNRHFTLINVLGLSVGLACFIFIMLYIIAELSYDKHHLKYKRIYRLELDFTISDRNQKVAKTPFPFGPVFKKEFPQIEEFVRFRPLENTIFRYKDKEFKEDKVFFTDPAVFRIFTHEFIHGSPGSALDEPNSIVITESLANRYFDNESGYGKVLNLKNGLNCKVTGIIKDPPENSHLKFDALISISSFESLIGKEMYHDLNTIHFWAIRLFTYILIKENCSIDDIYAGFPKFYDTYVADLSKKLNGTYRLLATRLDRIHLHSSLDWDLPVGNLTYIYLFSVIAIFILLIASINYMNLATAHSASKAKEVGIRKVLGAQRPQLIRYFLTESIVLSFIGLIIAIYFVETFMPFFNTVSGKELDFSYILSIEILIVIIIITFLVGVISGSYPSFYLSSIMPARVLKEQTNTGRKSASFRKFLIVFQFFISIIMIIGIIVISSQLNFLMKKDLGYNNDNILVVQVQDTSFIKKIDAFRNDILQHPGVESFSTSSSIMGLGIPMDVMYVEEEKQMQEQLTSFMTIDYDYFDLMDIEIVKGRNFNERNMNDTYGSVIINETAERKFNWGKTAIGKKVVRGLSRPVEYKVIGVVKDIHFNSLHMEMGPMMFFLNEDPDPILNIKIRDKTQKEVIAYLEEVWKKYDNGASFIFNFLDEKISEFYDDERNLSRIFGFFTLLSIFIALLGLFSLSSYVSEQSRKEVGIRKAFGASLGSLVYLLTRDFVKLVVIALIVAMPFAWYVSYRWLQNFAYSVDIQIWWFIAAALISIVIALLTVSYQAYKTAVKNPVEALKYE